MEQPLETVPAPEVEAIQPPKKKKSKKKLVLLIVALLLCLALVGTLIIGVVLTIVMWNPIRYQYAYSLLDDGKYRQAYETYIKLDDYENCSELALVTLLNWQLQVLESGDPEAAGTFCDTITLTPAMQERYSAAMTAFLQSKAEADYWITENGLTENGQVYMLLLAELPSQDPASEVMHLFQQLDQAQSRAAFARDNRDLMEQYWSVNFIRDLAIQDDCIIYFLAGRWTSADRLHFFLLTPDESASNTYVSSHSFPVPGAFEEGYTIQISDATLQWQDASGNMVGQVIGFNIVNFDTIEVYCYKNSGTYTLFR